MFQAANPTTIMITRNTPPPLVGSKGKSRFATSTRAERASGGTIKIVNSNAISSDKNRSSARESTLIRATRQHRHERCRESGKNK